MAESPRYGVSDALLPLLDVALLLLGLFIIIFQVEVALSRKQESQSPERLSLPGNVVIVQIDRNARILFHDASGKVDVRGPDVLQRDYLRGLRLSDPDTIVLTTLDNPWCGDSSTLYKQCRQAIRQERLRQARLH